MYWWYVLMDEANETILNTSLTDAAAIKAFVDAMAGIMFLTTPWSSCNLGAEECCTLSTRDGVFANVFHVFRAVLVKLRIRPEQFAPPS